MNPAHLHLVLNHLPIIGIPLATLLLLYAIFSKSKDVLLAALGATTLVGALCIPAFLTGEPAEDIVERRAGVVKDMIEEHEEAAEAGFVAALAMGGIGAVATFWVLKKGTIPGALLAVVVVSQVVASGLLARAGNLGGVISHPEIREGQPAADGASESGDAPVSEREAEGERDHDD
jgi:hypothetical protein